MDEKILKFENNRVNKKVFHKSKQPVDLAQVNVYETVVSGKFKNNDECFKHLLVIKKAELLNHCLLIYRK